MSRFFDLNNRTLHSVVSYAGAVKFSLQRINAVKVVERGNNDELPMSPRLRREHGSDAAAGRMQQFFSTFDRDITPGNFDLAHPSNHDLIEAAATVTHR